FAQEFLATAGLRCRLDLPVEVPAWPLTAETRHNLFLAFKEVLNNVVRHAAATEVRISLALRADAFVLTVRDNGRGFSTTAADAPSTDRHSSGHGLANFRKRLERIGGTCAISSETQGGTSVSFVVAVAGPMPPPAPPRGPAAAPAPAPH